jgi:hypothetical protein
VLDDCVLIQCLLDAMAAAPTPSPSPLPGPESGTDTTNAGGASTLLTSATLIAALIAAVVAGISAYLQRKTGREAASASHKSAEASERSAKAAEAAVTLNAENATAAGRRTDAESLSKRYQDAAAQLGHDKAAVRLAGVYAMARLADDWADQRQTCVDVLCAYLRMPVGVDGSGAESAADIQVRTAIQQAVAQHLVPGAAVSWSSLAFDFHGAVFDDLNLYRAVFERRPDFAGAVFRGSTSLSGHFGSELQLTSARIEGRLSLQPERLAGLTDMEGLVIATGGELNILYTSYGPNQVLSMKGMRVEGRLVGSVVAPATDEPLFYIFMDDVHVEKGFVDFRIGIPGLDNNPFLFARSWTANDPERIYLESVEGQGTPPEPYANAVFRLNDFAVAGDGTRE